MNNNPNILVIDDDPLVREVIEQFLGSSGYNYRSAADGVAGLDMVNADPPDLVITDILMPKKEGMETIMRSAKLIRILKSLPYPGKAGRGPYHIWIWHKSWAQMPPWQSLFQRLTCSKKLSKS